MIRRIGNYEITGNGSYKDLIHARRGWSEEEELAFYHKGELYFLDEFTRIDPEGTGSPFTIKDDSLFGIYDGIKGESYFSGVVIKLTPCGDAIQVYDYIIIERMNKIEA